MALLGHDQFGQAIDPLHVGGPLGMRVVGLGIVALDRALGLARSDVVILAEHEQDDVGILLDRSRFAKVGEHRALVLTLFDRAAELRQRQHRHVQLFGQRLQAATDLGNLVDPVVLRPARSLEQLEVIDHDQPDIVTALQTPSARAQRGDRQRRGIVDVQRQFGKALAGERELLEILAADLAHPQHFARNARLFGQNTRGKLVGAHFQAEKRHRRADRFVRSDPICQIAAHPVGGVEGDVGGERGLAHARASGKDQQIRFVQAADLLVHRSQPGGGARDVPARKQRLLDHPQRGARGNREGLRLTPAARPVGDRIERGLGLFDLLHRRDIVRSVHRPGDEVAPDRDKLAQQRQIVDLLGQFARREQTLPVGGQPGQIGDSAQLLERLVRLEIGFERHRGDDCAAIHQLEDSLIDALVERLEEMHRTQVAGVLLDHPVVDQRRPDERRLRLEIRGQRADAAVFAWVRCGKGDRFAGHVGSMRWAGRRRQGRCDERRGIDLSITPPAMPELHWRGL